MRAALDRALCGQEDAKTGLLLALLAREHAYLEGPPGCGKTRLADALAVAAGVRSAAIRFHRDTRLADLLGDERLLRRRDGATQHLTREIIPGPLLEAELAILDDLPRAPGEAVAALLQLLSQRRAAGRELPLETAIATALPPELDAWADPLEPNQLDRFAVQVRMGGLLQQRRWEQARQLLDHGERETSAAIAAEQRRALQERCAKLPVSGQLPGQLLALVRRLAAVAGPADRTRLSDRSFSRAALRILRAHALLRGAASVASEDLVALRLMLARRVSEDVQRVFPALLRELLEPAPPGLAAPAGAKPGAQSGAAGAGTGVRVGAAGERLDRGLPPGRASEAPPPPAEVGALLAALSGRIERGRAEAREHPGGSPRGYRRLRHLDELFDADPLEAILFAEGGLPGGPRVFRRERREAGGSLALLRDVSASMEGRLSRWTGQVVAGVLRLGARRQMRLGYVEFNHDATRFAADGRFFHRRYPRLLARAARRRAEGRTNYEAPLRVALEEFARRPGCNRHVVLLTDGIPVLGDPEVARERALAVDLHVRIHTVFLGLGDCPAVLDAISSQTGGLRFHGRPTPDGGLRVCERP